MKQEDIIKKASECLLKKLDGRYNSKDVDVLNWIWKEAQKELYNKYISKWSKEVDKYSSWNKYKQYSQTFINEFERDLKEILK